MTPRILSLDDPSWSETLSRLPHDFYHRPAYVDLDARRTQSVPEALVVEDGTRLFFVPYLVRPCESLGLDSPPGTADAISPYGYPGVLLSDDGRDLGFVAQAWNAFRETLESRGVCSVFLRMHPILGDGFPDLFPPGAFGDATETVAVDLHLDERALWKGIRMGHQETIKKCQKLGYVARFVPFTDVIDPFLVIYEQTMDRVKAKDSYYFGRDYFIRLSEMDDVHCCVVESDSTIIAACLFFEVGGIVQAHLGGTRSDFLAKSPFHMTLFHAMSWGKTRGNRWLHLGGGVGGGNDRLLQFKAGFSSHRFTFHTSRLVVNSALYRQMVVRRAQTLNTDPETLLASNFFPAYRSS